MLGDIAGELLGGVLRVVASLFSEVVFELLLKGCGYAIIRLIRPRSDPSEGACAVVGILFWVGVVALGWLSYRFAVAA
jgi:hypothetical protein